MRKVGSTDMPDERHLATAFPMVRRSMGILMMMENQTFLDGEKKKHGSAALLGKTECQRCGLCCLRRPCIPTPDELTIIASFLNLSVRDILKTKMVLDTGKGSYHPVWAQETQADMVGRVLPYNRTYDRGYCQFFDRNTHDCLIYEVRPESAKMCQCWTEDDYKFNPVDYWSKELLLKLCPELNFNEDED